MTGFAERILARRFLIFLSLCWLSTPLSATSTFDRAPEVYKPAVGFIGGCTGTVVSPPGAEVTSVVFAAHCHGGETLKLPSGFVSGFSCYQNRDYYDPAKMKNDLGEAGDDVGVCFSTQKPATTLPIHGCIAKPPGVGELLRFMGFGNPNVGFPPVDTLLQGVSSVLQLRPNGALLTDLQTRTVPGDSGGPVVKASDNGAFEIVGVTSGSLNEWDEVVQNGMRIKTNERTFNSFASFSEKTKAFFTRAMERFRSEKHAPAPQICGINWQRGTTSSGSVTPTVTPTASVSPAGTGGAPGTAPSDNGNSPGVSGPSPGSGGAHDSDGGNPGSSQPRAIDNRPPSLIFGERMRLEFPRSLGEVTRFLGWLSEIGQEEIKRKLTEVLRDPSGGEFREFINGLGVMPATALLNKIRDALVKSETATAGKLGKPESDWNAPWLKVLNDPGVAFRRPDQSLALLNTLRAMARKGDAGNGELEAAAARWAASMTSAQRKRATELLGKLQLPSEGVPADAHAADQKVLRFLTQSLVERPISGPGAQPDNAAAKAQKQARDFAANWNKTLAEAVPDINKVDLDKQVTAHEKSGEKLKVGDWIRKYVHEVGYDELVRWASSVGGDTGKRTLALLARLNGKPGEPSLGISVDKGKKIVVQTAPDKQTAVESDAELRFSAQPETPPIDLQLRSLLSGNGNDWESVRFVPADKLPTGPHPQVGFEKLAIKPPPPPPAGELGAAPPPVAGHAPAANAPQDEKKSGSSGIVWPIFKPMTPTPTPTSSSSPPPVTSNPGAPAAGGSGPTPTATPTRGSGAPSAPQPDNIPPRSGDATKPVVSGPVGHAMGACVNCHKANDLPGVSSPEQLADKIGDMNEGRFEEMLRRALAKDPSIDHGAMREFYRAARRFHESNSASFSGQLPACYGGAAARQQALANMPGVEASSSALAFRLASAKRASHMLFYDDNTVPRTFMVGRSTDDAPGTPAWGMGSPLRDGGTLKEFGYHNHANAEFPWNKSAGTDNSPNVATKHFVIPATNSLGEFVSVPSSPDLDGRSTNITNGDGFTVRFDAGTTFGEEIQVKDPDTGEALTTEIRLRSKKADGTWKMDVLRPFENPSELAAAVRRLVETRPQWGQDPKVQRFLAAMDNPVASIATQDSILNQAGGIPPRSLNSAAIDALQARAPMHELPELPHEIVRTLLKTTPFKSVFGKPWIEKDGVKGWAPTTLAAFSIVPQRYAGAFVEMSDNACMKCHASAGRHVDNFDHPQMHGFGTLEDHVRREGRSAPFKNRSWYDNVRGMYGEGILSWNPGDVDTFRQRMASQWNMSRVGPWSFNQCLSQGLIRGLPRQ